MAEILGCLIPLVLIVLIGLSLWLLQRWRNGQQQGPAPPAVRSSMRAYPLAIESDSYQDNLEWICRPTTSNRLDRHLEAVLVCEDNNPQDPHAVRVDIRGLTVGYLSRHDALAYRSALASSGRTGASLVVAANIRRRWRPPSADDLYEVWLDLSLASSSSVLLIT